MYVKQIDQKAALELAARGKEVLVMVPAGKDPGWEGMMPDTLGHMLEGCMFFRREPAAKIADELRVTERTVYAHLQKFREEGENHEENTENAGAGTGA